MSRTRFLVIAAAAILSLVLALYFSSLRHLSRDTQGALLLPTLGAALNSITDVTIRKGAVQPKVHLHQAAGNWIVVERGGYPADMAKLRKLLLGLSEARVIEEKTSNPDSYAAIGVGDPSAPGAVGAEVTTAGSDGAHRVIVGKSVGGGNFVRLNETAVSYLVEPGISFETEPQYWIDPSLLNVASDKIQSLDVKPAAGPSYRLARAPAGSDGFTLTAALPPGRRALDAKSLGPSPTAFSNLTADDVAEAARIDLKNPSTVVVTLGEGDTVTLEGVEAGDKRWVTVAAAKNEALATKTKGRAFEVARYRYDAIFRPLEQLLEPLPAPAAKPTAVAKPAPASTKHGTPPKPAA